LQLILIKNRHVSGDIVPSDSRYALLAFFFVLTGLSVVSMCFNVLQAKAEALFNSLISNIDQEYKRKQLEQETNDFEASGSEPLSSGMGVMQIYKCELNHTFPLSHCQFFLESDPLVKSFYFLC